MAIRRLGAPREEAAAPTNAETEEKLTFGPKKRQAPAEEPAAETPADEPESGSPEHRALIREQATTPSGVGRGFSDDIRARLQGDMAAKAPAEPVETPAPAPAPESKKTKKSSPAPTSEAVSTPSTSAAVAGDAALTPRERLDAIVDMFRTAVEAALKL